MGHSLKDIFKDAPAGAGRYGVVGYPLEHTISPAMHRAAIKALGVNAVYEAIPVPPGEWQDFVRRGVQELFLDGFNVTLPYKESIWPDAGNFPILTHGHIVRFSGAVNTMVRHEQIWECDNTDGAGFLDDIAANGISASGVDVVLLGAGGSARALLFAMQTLMKPAPRAVTIINRSRPRAEKLMEDFAKFGKQLRVQVSLAETEEDQRRAMARAALLVNATSVGLSPGEKHLVDFDQLRVDMTVYDLVYHRETELMAAARARGARVFGGLGMLVRQGARAFEIWFNQKPSIEVMTRAAREEIERRNRRPS